MKILTSQQEQILKLAHESPDLSLREIGRRVGVSHSTVNRVLRNGRVVGPEEEKARREYRCEGCGRIVFVEECILCRDRKALGIKVDMAFGGCNSEKL